MQFFTAILSALALAAATTASPVHIAERSELIVVTPTITKPAQGDEWPIGSTTQVCWKTHDIPPEASNYKGSVLLGYDDGTDSENLDTDHPLASGFLLTAGCVDVTVPNVTPRTTYFVVLVGDSGDTSGQFSIVVPVE